MIELNQYRTRIGLFAVVTSSSSKKRHTKCSLKNVRNISKSEAKKLIKTTTKSEFVISGQGLTCFLLHVGLCLLCCVLLYFMIQFNIQYDTFCGSQCTSIEIPNMYGSRERLEFLDYGNVTCQLDMLSVNYCDTLYYFDVNGENVIHYDTSIEFHGNTSEYRIHLPSAICVEHSCFIYQSIFNRPVIIQSLEMCPYPGTCCYLLGNKGMHSYNGNPPTGLNLTEEAIKKQRLYILLVDGGSQALRYTISRIVLDIQLQNVDGQTRGQLCVNDKSLLYPAGSVLPSLDGLTQTSLDMVWTKALQQSPVASVVTQDMIYDYLVSDGLDIQLKNTKQRVQELNNEAKLLSQRQWDILYPRLHVTVDLDSFDIPLLCFVILNVFQFKPTSGIWSQDPATGDVTCNVVDDILRLRKQRNKLVSSSASGLDDNAFETAWTEIRDILLHVRPGQEFLNKIQHLHDCQVDQGNAKNIEQLIADWINYDKRLERVESELSQIQEYQSGTREAERRKRKRKAMNTRQFNKDNRPKVMQEMVKAWKKEKINETKGIAATREKILLQNRLCVIGVPGAGKTTTIRHAALFLENEGFIIYCIDEPKELLEYFDENKKQVFILDDILGIYSIIKGEINLWIRQDNKIRNILGTDTKLLVSINTQIYNEAVEGNDLVFLDKHTCIDLSDKTYRLDGADMLGMLKHFLTIRVVDKVDDLLRQIFYPPLFIQTQLQDMTEEERQKMISRYTKEFIEFSHCFPLLCKVFCREEIVRHNPREFFVNPFQALIPIFSKIKSDNRIQYCGLVLCAVFDGELTNDMLSINCELDHELEKQSVTLRNVIMTSCDLEGQKYLPQIKSGLKSLDGVYVTRVGNTYQMLHRVFHDLVTYLFNDTDPSFLLKYGKREFIRERIRIRKAQPVDDPYVIIINDEKNIERLADRLFRNFKSDIETGYSKSSDVWTGARYIAENPNIDDGKLTTCLKSKLIDRGQTDKKMIDDLLRQCMKTVMNNINTINHGDVPQYKVIEACVQAGADCNICINSHSLFPLHISVQSGSLKLTKLLLNNGADKDTFDYLGYSVLQTLCSFTRYNRLEIFKLLIEHVDNQSVSVRHSERHNDILTSIDYLGRNILHWSVDDYAITEYVLTYHCSDVDINKRDDEGKTPFWYIVNNKKPEKFVKYIEDVVVVDKDDMIKLYTKHGATL